MRYELTDFEWSIIGPVLPDRSRGVPRVDDRCVLIRLALDAGQGHGRLLAGGLPPGLRYNEMLLADRVYDSDAVRELARERRACASIAPK
jgi:transposase